MKTIQPTINVAVKALIFNDQGQILILHKSDKDEVNPNTYDIPWGRMKFWETAQEALYREIKEEVDIEISPPKINRIRWYTKDNLQIVGMTFLAKHTKWIPHLSFEHITYIRKTPQEILQWNFPQRLQEEIKSIL